MRSWIQNIDKEVITYCVHFPGHAVLFCLLHVELFSSNDMLCEQKKIKILGVCVYGFEGISQPFDLLTLMQVCFSLSLFWGEH